MKYLLYGHRGWIGQELSKLLEQAGNTIIPGSRVHCVADVYRDLTQHTPNFVVCALGRTHGPGSPTIDYLQSDDKLTENLTCNLSAPVYIARATSNANIPLLYIGSGCVFTYDQGHPIAGKGFVEEDQPNFDGSAYSAVKGQTEKLVGMFPNVLSARIRMPIAETESHRDLITKILGYRKIVSIANSMTVLPDILPFLLAVLEQGKTGVINAVNPGTIDHEGIVKIFEKVSGTKHEYQLMSIPEQNQLLLAPRSNNCLDTTKAEAWLLDLPEHLRKKYSCPIRFPAISDRIREILVQRMQRRMVIGRSPDTSKIIMVTGGAGFIGSNFINYWMHKYPNDIMINLDSLEFNSNPRNILVSDRPSYHFVHGNLLDERLLEKVCKSFKFTHIIHFAAACNVDQSFVCPLNCSNINVIGTHVLLEAVRKYCTLQLFLLVSTDEVYGEAAEGAFSESQTVFAPSNPYAASKAAAECLVMSYGKSFHLPFIITRGNNIYGPGQYPAQAIPRFITSLLSGRPMPVHGKGQVTRRFLHVLDKCGALDVLVHSGTVGEVYNVGAGMEISVRELCRVLLEKVLGPGRELDEWIKEVKDRPYNDRRYAVDTGKLEKLGWTPKIPFEEGIQATIQWYVENGEFWGSGRKNKNPVHPNCAA